MRERLFPTRAPFAFLLGLFHHQLGFCIEALDLFVGGFDSLLEPPPLPSEPKRSQKRRQMRWWRSHFARKYDFYEVLVVFAPRFV